MHFDSLQGWLDWQESLHPKAIDLGLERAARVFCALNPEYVKPVTITVAGTNGKGSCIAYLEEIYRAQGYRVGSYTSPHLLKYNERIKIDGKAVDDAVICRAFERIESVRDAISLSYFEFGTLAAIDIFHQSELDVQLLEVGLGGRLDAVNIIDPDVSIVTSICIDHCDWLGETREAIGREKAGIFRPGVPAVIGDPHPPESLLQSAAVKQAPAYCIGRDFHYVKQTDRWDWVCGQRQLRNLPLPALQGEHQFRNASSVILALDAIAQKLPVCEQSIRQGLSNVHLTGRYQLIPGEIPVLLDVGHNPQAARALADYLQRNFPGRRLIAVFTMMKDKDIKGVLGIMKPLVDRWYVAPLRNPRTATEQMLRDAFHAGGIDRVAFGFDGFSETYSAAKKNARKDDLILVFGSFFLVAEFLSTIETKQIGE